MPRPTGASGEGPRVQAPPLASVPSAVIASGSCCRGRRFLFLRLATCAPSEHQTVVLGSGSALEATRHSQGKIPIPIAPRLAQSELDPKFVRQVTAAPKWTPSAKLKLPRFQLQFTQPDLSQAILRPTGGVAKDLLLNWIKPCYEFCPRERPDRRLPLPQPH